MKVPRGRVKQAVAGKAGRAAAFGLLLALTTSSNALLAGSSHCAVALTTAELAKISPGAEEMSTLERSAGHSECAWMLKGSGDSNTLSLTFWEPGAMADALVPADSPEEFFETYVKSAEQVRGTKREVLKGVGKRSALFRDGKVRELYVLTKAGVAHLVADALTDAQVSEVAMAVAAP